MSAITAKASRKMKKYAVLTREPRCFLGSFDFSWEQRKFEEIAVRSSVICSDDTLPRVEYEDIVSGTGRLNKDIYAKRSIKSGIAFHQGDVLYGKLRPYLQNWLLPTFDGLAVGDFWVLQPQNADSSFLYRLIQSRQFDEVANQSTGTKMPRADWKLVSKTVFSIPSNISEQAAIGTYFTALDSLITLHQRKCANLCSPSQVVFSLLFATSTFSWEQRKLGDVVQITMGQSPDGSTYSDEPSDYILVQGNADLQNGWVCPRIWTTQITKKADAGDLIMSVRAPAGAMGKTAYNAVIGRGVAAIKGNEFIYQLLVKMDADGFWKTLSCGSTFESLNSDNIKNAEVKIPTTAEQIKIGGYFQQLDNLITLHQRECISFTGRADRLILTANKKRTTSSWEQRKVGDLLIERNQQAPMSDEYPLMAFIANEGVAPKGERYDRSALVTDTVNKLYKKTEKGDFIYSSNNLETGSIGLNKYGKACISPVYSIFEPTGIADSDFLGRRLVRKDFINAMVKWRQGVIYGQWRIHESDFLKIEITVPSVEEQRKIGTYLDQLDHLITLHQRKPFLMKWRTSDANRNQTNRLVL